MKKVKLWLLASLPLCITYVLALFYVLPKHVGGLSSIMPLVHLMPIFIWGVMHSRDMPLILVALLGLMIDVATSLPMGVSALSYSAFLILVRTQRKYIYREGFAAMWGYFAVLLLAMQIMAAALYAFSLGTMPTLGAGFMQWLLSVLTYPIIHRIFYPWVEKLAAARYRLLHA